MSRMEDLKRRIEEERCRLDQLLATTGMSEVLEQSRKLDGLIEEYLELAE